MAFDHQSFKTQFPLFHQTENQSLVYLDNAATTQKPQCVIDAITHYYVTQNGNAQRASHRLARTATEMVENTRDLAVQFLGASYADEVVFTSGATAALNMIAYGLSDYCHEGDNIVLSRSEHHANLLPWQRLAASCGGELTFIPSENGLVNFERWKDVVNQRTRVITFSAASNVLGHMPDLSVIADIKRSFPNIIVIVDASQIACHTPLQASQWKCDFLVCSAHKFYGPTGVGLMYGRPQYLHTMSPQIVGGEMVDKVELSHSTFVHGAQRLEAGTSSLSAIAGLGACLQFWQEQDRPAMMAYEQELTAYLYQQLTILCQKNNGLQLISDVKNNVGIAVLVSVDSDGCQLSLSDLAHWLDEHNIAARVGDHCAQPLWKSLEVTYGSNKGLRFSLAAYNTKDDIDYLIAAISSFLVMDENTAPVGDDLSILDWQDLLVQQSWQRRFKTLVQWGRHIEVKPHVREQQFLVKGCESAVWLQHQQKKGRHYFLMDSDSNIIKGLSALLLMWFNGKTTKEIQAIDVVSRYQALGLQKHLSQSRMNGFVALLDAMRIQVR